MNQPPLHASSPFRGRHYDSTVIILCVRWYITYKLSYRDLVEMMAERRADLSHTTILRWVQYYVPEFERRWNCYARPGGISRRVGETYIKVRGRWSYHYRTVDKHGLTVDFLLSARRDITAAKRFFTRAVQRHGAPARITLDGCPATRAAVAELKASGVMSSETKVWTSKYLNNLVEQDHRRVKQRVYPMHGFKGFRNAKIAIKGIELAQKIRKWQFDTSGVIVSGGARVPHVWEAVLAARGQAWGDICALC